MTQIIFENEAGQLRLGGGRGEPWRMTEISGLGMSGKNFQTAVYYAEAGQKTVGEQRSARVITIAGDVCGGQVPAAVRMARAVKILDKPGWLVVRAESKTRRIWARCTAFEQAGRHGPFRQFRLQFCCDCPYFEAVGRDEIALFERSKELKTTFTLPQMFSSRTSKGIVINCGDVYAEPVFEIYFGTATADGETVSITLQNQSTAQSIVISLAPTAGETVTVDVPNRKIYNSRGDNLISALAEDCYLSRFKLQEGANEICVESSVATGLSVVCRFTNRYLEAVC